MKSELPESNTPKKSHDWGYSYFKILALPQSVRVRIWIILGFSHTRRLRLVCSVIKKDIDTVAGISSAIDSSYEDFKFQCHTAIRKAAIHELFEPPYVEFLKYPLSLRELEIRGEITPQTFFYILKSSPNIAKIQIVFNKYVLDHKANIFPLPPEVSQHRSKPLSKLSSIKVISSTKKMAELLYVYKIVGGLLNALPINGTITSLQILMTHKSPSVYMNELMATTVLLVHKHGGSLKELNLIFKSHDHDLESKPIPQAPPSKPVAVTKSPITLKRDDSFVDIVKKAQPPAPPQPPHQRKDIHNDEQLQTSDTAAAPSLEEDEAEADADNDDSELVDTNDRIAEAFKYLDENPWPSAVQLKALSLFVPYKIMEYVSSMISPVAKLEAINLESSGNPRNPANNWNLYKKILSRANLSYLKLAVFHHISNEDSRGISGAINLKLFKPCQKLIKLTLTCEKKDSFEGLCRASNIASLPDSLREINLERVHLTPCQAFRLIFCLSNLDQICISYWSMTDCQFGCLMRLLKWGIARNLTDCHKIYLVDTKIRFTNNMKVVRRLQETLDVSAKYQDVDETSLVIDKDMTKSEAKQITISNGNPSRRQTPKRVRE